MKLWIARDFTGLWAFSEKPNEYYSEFIGPTSHCKTYKLDSELFPEVTFENSPQKVKIELIKE